MGWDSGAGAGSRVTSFVDRSVLMGCTCLLYCKKPVVSSRAKYQNNQSSLKKT
jgi:hypothetical protein